MLNTLAVHGYRSLRDVVVPLDRITVVSGPNGCGKSSLSHGLRLVSQAANGSLVGSLAAAGGLPSVLWAGPEQISGAMRRGDMPIEGTARRRRPVSLMIGFRADDFGYLIDVGLPVPGPSLFGRDPQIKREVLWAGADMRPATTLLRRAGHRVQIRSEEWVDLPRDLTVRESMLSEVDPDASPEGWQLARRMRGWRFHDQFRSDAAAPARRPAVGTHTPVLAHDGADLAPAIQTILESAQADLLREEVDRAFEGAALSVRDGGLMFELQLSQPGLLRRLGAAELSDGTLRFLLHAAALLSPALPELMVLDEPETGLHPRLVESLARIITAASSRTQIMVLAHDRSLIDLLREQPGVGHLELQRSFAETTVLGQGLMGRPAWNWGRR